MKNIFKSLIIIGCALLSFSCTNSENGTEIKPNKKTSRYHFVISANENRTAIVDNSEQTGGNFVWNNEASDCFTFVNLSNEATEQIASTDFGVDSDTGLAEIGADLTAQESYTAVYPTSAVASDNADKTAYKLTLNSVQTNVEYDTSKYSFDPSADILVARPFTTPEDNSGLLPLCLKRLNAVGRLQIRGLNTGENITKVEFIAAGKVLTGQFSVNLSNGIANSYENESNSSSVAVIYEGGGYNVAIDGNLAHPVWFSCFPTTLASGDSYTIVVTTETQTFTKTGTIGTNPLIFSEGQVTSFKANFTGVEGINLPDIDNPEEEKELIDTLTYTVFGIENASETFGEYTYISTKTGITYKANMASDYESIHIGGSTNSGIVVAGNPNELIPFKVAITWNSRTSAGRSLSVYARTTVYSDTSDLHGTNKGERLCQVMKTDSILSNNSLNTILPYIGFRSNSGAIYITEIQIYYNRSSNTTN